MPLQRLNEREEMKSRILLLSAICLFVLPAVAEEVIQPLAKQKRAFALDKDPVTLAVLADQLASLGESGNDPLAYVMAAKIQKGLSVRSAGGGKGGDDNRYTYFIERAKTLAGASGDYQAIIERVESVRMRGVLSAMTQHRDMVSASAKQSIRLTFKGGEDAGIALMLDATHPGYARRAEIDLDLYVLDEAGHRVCVQEGPGVPELCQWTPQTTGKFTAEIVNRGSVEAPYVLNFR